jgi:predicted NAD/FAD-binding protein
MRIASIGTGISGPTSAIFAQFFKNHGFLNIKDQPQWLTVTYDMNILQSIGDIQMQFAKPSYRRNELRPAL